MSSLVNSEIIKNYLRAVAPRENRDLKVSGFDLSPKPL